MVRYPKKNPLFETAKQQEAALSQEVSKTTPQALPVSPRAIDKPSVEEIKPPVSKTIVEPVEERSPNASENSDVKFLKERLSELEHKIKTLEQHETQEKAVNHQANVSVKGLSVYEQISIHWHKYHIAIIASVVSILIVAGVLVLKSRVHEVQLEFSIKQREFALQSDKLTSQAGSLAGVLPQSDILNQLLNGYVIDVKVLNSGNRILLSVFGFNQDHLKSVAVDFQKKYQEKYQAYRRGYLKDLLHDLDKKKELNRGKISSVLKRMRDFQENERVMVLSASTKNSIDVVAKQRALDLEQDLAVLKKQLDVLSRDINSLSFTQDQKDQLYMIQFRLTDMEFKKVLLTKEAYQSYEQGMRVLKKKTVELINAQAKQEQLDISVAALIIKRFMIESKVQALEFILNKKYVVIDNVSGRQEQYARLKIDFDQTYLILDQIDRVYRQIEEFGHKNLLEEIAYQPIKVIKN